MVFLNSALYFVRLFLLDMCVFPFCFFLSLILTHLSTFLGYIQKFTLSKKELLDIGKIIVQDNCGNDIPMYDLERTVCDLMRSRNSIEVQEFNSVIKAYVARKDKNLNRLMEYAKLFRVENVIRRYMGVLL